MKRRTGRPAVWLFIGIIFSAGVLAAWAGFKKIPPEAAMAALRNSELLRYLPDRYREADHEYRQLMQRWEREMKKWIWLRRFDSFRSDFTAFIRSCADIHSELIVMIQNRAGDLSALADELSAKTQSMRRFTVTINEGRVARKALTRAELALAQSCVSVKTGRLDQAEELLNQAQKNLKSADSSLSRILNRYRSDEQLDRWQSWIRETIAESRRRKSLAVVVSKIDRRLFLYQNGHLTRSFQVGLGRNGLSDKRHAGDNATPEGRYRIHRKNPNSLYHKALLLNYPNEEDRQAYRKARAFGQIPPRVGIGNLIEIHGGGISFMTRGCIALENEDMDLLYQLLPQGTPVTIVGSMDKVEDWLPQMEKANP